MRTVYLLSYKNTDSKGREKYPKFVGVFKTLEQLEEIKQKMIEERENLSFQVHVSQSIF